MFEFDDCKLHYITWPHQDAAHDYECLNHYSCVTAIVLSEDDPGNFWSGLNRPHIFSHYWVLSVISFQFPLPTSIMFDCIRAIGSGSDTIPFIQIYALMIDEKDSSNFSIANILVSQIPGYVSVIEPIQQFRDWLA